MVFRHGIVKGLIKLVLPKAANVVKQPDNFSKCSVMRRKVQVFGKSDGICRHIARVNFLNANPLHDLCIVRIKGFNVFRHPVMHTGY